MPVSFNKSIMLTFEWRSGPSSIFVKDKSKLASSSPYNGQTMPCSTSALPRRVKPIRYSSTWRSPKPPMTARKSPASTASAPWLSPSGQTGVASSVRAALFLPAEQRHSGRRGCDRKKETRIGQRGRRLRQIVSRNLHRRVCASRLPQLLRKAVYIDVVVRQLINTVQTGRNRNLRILRQYICLKMRPQGLGQVRL